MSDFLRSGICRVGASLYARGYVHATAGNISVRTDDGYLVTPTDACLGDLDPARLAEVNEAGVQTAGVLEELEETARLWSMTRPSPLTSEQIDDLRRHLGAIW